MQPKIVTIQGKTVIGVKSSMTHGAYENIMNLWKQFMPRKKELSNTINSDLIAIQEYSDFNNMALPFTIWACAEVENANVIPEGFESLIIPEGLYAVFLQKGMNGSSKYQRIVSEWLPNSRYTIDNRPHFQIMGDKYKNGSPDSEEDFYVPIKPKN
ncbi:GyrI-like domain-containing protein [Winogradskyella sp.]|uniref:GyrI-like domain-containing protein n=1 Tax=Winogradskyella sp. TaxID=1883156 RepID=UPI003F6B25CC